jgi:ABC-type phosphate transport system substrate-binding protein
MFTGNQMKSFRLAVAIALLFTGIALLGSSPGMAADDTLVIIANKAVPQDNITPSELKQIFLRQRAHWRGGGKIVAMNAKPGTLARKAFQKKVLGMDYSAERAFWEEQKIKTGLIPPLSSPMSKRRCSP